VLVDGNRALMLENEETGAGHRKTWKRAYFLNLEDILIIYSPVPSAVRPGLGQPAGATRRLPLPPLDL
jgi:hypothetical protein